MQLALTGHSKFKVEIIQMGDRNVVAKSAPDDESYRRLRAQMYKQFHSPMFYDKFMTPEYICEIGENRSFLMEYLPFEAPCNWLLSQDASGRHWFYRQVAEYIRHIFKISIKDKFDHMHFSEKVCRTSHIIAANPITSTIHNGFDRVMAVTKDLLARTDEMIGKVDYLGWCHGDLTLSNLLIDGKGKNVAWIDFMDGWDHSPYIDMAKLAQETRYLWSLRFRHEKPTKNIKVAYEQRLGELNQVLLQHLPKDIDYGLLRSYILLNDFRLLQYEKDRVEFDIILRNIHKGLHE